MPIQPLDLEAQATCAIIQKVQKRGAVDAARRQGVATEVPGIAVVAPGAGRGTAAVTATDSHGYCIGCCEECCDDMAAECCTIL